MGFLTCALSVVCSSTYNITYTSLINTLNLYEKLSTSGFQWALGHTLWSASAPMTAADSSWLQLGVSSFPPCPLIFLICWCYLVQVLPRLILRPVLLPYHYSVSTVLKMPLWVDHSSVFERLHVDVLQQWLRKAENTDPEHLERPCLAWASQNSSAHCPRKCKWPRRSYPFWVISLS